MTAISRDQLSVWTASTPPRCACHGYTLFLPTRPYNCIAQLPFQNTQSQYPKWVTVALRKAETRGIRGSSVITSNILSTCAEEKCREISEVTPPDGGSIGQERVRIFVACAHLVPKRKVCIKMIRSAEAIYTTELSSEIRARGTKAYERGKHVWFQMLNHVGSSAFKRTDVLG